MADVQWTESQRRAIHEVGRSVVVSAAAGAGKTAVLAERCVYLVCDAPAEHRCDVDGLLVLTYTEAAAAEMKDRIRSKFRERLLADPVNLRIREQSALLDTADISTIHAFCLKQLRRWFNKADLDPAAAVLQPDQASLMKTDSLDQLTESLYESQDVFAARFRELLDQYGLGDDAPIKSFVRRLSDYLESLPDPDAWISESMGRLAGGTERLFACVIQPLHGAIDQQLASLTAYAQWTRSCNECIAYYGRLFTALAERLGDWRARLAELPPELSDSRAASPQWVERFDLIRGEIAAFEWSSKGAPRKPRDASPEDAAQIGHVRAIRDQVSVQFKSRVRNICTRFTAAESLAALDRIAPFVATICELTRRFRAAYADAKRRASVIDFSDFERSAHGLLQDDEIAQSLRRRFAHILVDEYQDINPLQNAILQRISRENDPRHAANMFTVGDVKQSIYSFREAEPEVFRSRFARCANETERMVGIHLQSNFRSQPRILAALNQLFSRMMHESVGGIAYGESEALHAGRTESGERRSVSVDVHLLDAAAQDVEDDAESEDESRDSGFVDPDDPGEWESCEREAYVIVMQIRQMMAEDAALRPGSFAVLLRAPTYRAEAMAAVLNRSGIPAEPMTPRALLDTTEIRDLRALLQVVDNPRQDIPLAAVLRSPILGESMTEDELLAARNSDRSIAFHAAVIAHSQSQSVAGLKIARLLRRIDQYRQSLRDRSLSDVVWEIIESSGYLAYVGGLDRGDQRRRNLLRFHESARQFGAFKQQGLRRFVEFIDSLEATERDIASSPASSLSTGVEAVRIMSIHASKGLEFPIVFVADLGRRFNLTDKRGLMVFDRRAGIGLRVVDPVRMIEFDSPAHTLVSAGIDLRVRAEEIRLLYVAMTRARERLVLIGRASSSAIDAARRAGDEQSRLAPLDIQTASSALDWIVPALGTMPGGMVAWPGEQYESPLFRVATYDADAMSQWRLEAVSRPKTTPVQQAVARLDPLPPDEPASVDRTAAERIVDRVKFNYPHLSVTGIHAVVAASEVKGVYDLLSKPADFGAPRWLPAEPARTEPRNRINREEAARRGSAMHKALQHIDFARAGDASSVRMDLDRLVEAKLLTASEAELADVDTIAWFAATSLGRAIRDAGDGYRREFMFMAAHPATMFDPTLGAGVDERVLVRGTADGVLPRDGAIEIVDYKTDDIAASDVAARMERHAGQMKLYAASISPICRKPVRCAWLVFLRPRVIMDIKDVAVSRGAV